ncbi:MAG: head GIN domain-containing protein [Gemmatimonadota bacterium]
MTILRSILPFVAVVLGGCDLVGGEVIRGSGPVLSEDRYVERFTSVSNATVADVEILQGPYDNVRVRAQSSLLPYLRTRVTGNELRIYTDSDIQLRPTEPIIVEVDMGSLYRITSSGSGDVIAPYVDGGRVEIVSSGAGDIEMYALLADTVVVHGSGSGFIEISGDVLRQRIVLSGSGPLDARNLDSYRVDATISGSGTATVRARDWLRAVLSGSGDLRYYGNPSVEQSVTGSGRVQRVGS